MRDPEDRARFAQAFLALAEVHAREISDRLVEMYFRALIEFDIGIVESAVEKAVRTLRFFPKPVELLEACLEREASQRLASAEEAWGIVVNAFERIGSYREFPADTPGGAMLKKAVDAIGWKRLCASTNQEADRAHFMRIYAHLAARDVTDRILHRTALTLEVDRPGDRLALEPPECERVAPGRRHISELAAVIGNIGNGGKQAAAPVDYEARKELLRDQARLLRAAEAAGDR